MSEEVIETLKGTAAVVTIFIVLPIGLLLLRDRMRRSRHPRPEHIRSREYSFSFTRIPKDLLDQHTAESRLTDSMGPYVRILFCY